MSVLTKLKNAIETAGHEAFDIQPLMTGSVAIWNVPKGYSLQLEKELQDAIKVENLQAIRRLADRGINFKTKAYRLSIDKSTIEANNTTNFRISIKYTGPYMKAVIPGIYNNREELLTWLQDMLALIIKKLVAQKPLVAEAPEKGKTITITYASKYAQLVGVFRGDQMNIKITPSRNDYTNLIKDNMPLAVQNMAIRLRQVAPSAILYHMNAAGLPVLKRVGAVVDQIVETRALLKS